MKKLLWALIACAPLLAQDIVGTWLNRKGVFLHRIGMRACRSGGRRIHLKMSERDKEICRWLLQP